MKFFKVLKALILILAGASTTFAQMSVPNTVNFNDFSFSFDSALATHVNITQYLTEPEDVFPPQGKHTHFLIYGDQLPEANVVGIRVYRIGDLAEYEHTQQQVTRLQELLVEQHDFTDDVASTDSHLPFLPVVAAGQTIRARVQYVTTPTVTGISYITAYQQAAEPLRQNDFLYTFQGISVDGVYYVSAVFQVNPESFPTEIPTDFDYQAFLNQLPDYLSENTAQLSNATPQSFAPSLNMLDEVVQSFSFKS